MLTPQPKDQSAKDRADRQIFERQRIKAMLVETAMRNDSEVVAADKGAAGVTEAMAPSTPAEIIAYVQPLYEWIVKP